MAARSSLTPLGNAQQSPVASYGTTGGPRSGGRQAKKVQKEEVTIGSSQGESWSVKLSAGPLFELLDLASSSTLVAVGFFALAVMGGISFCYSLYNLAFFGALRAVVLFAASLYCAFCSHCHDALAQEISKFGARNRRFREMNARFKSVREDSNLVVKKMNTGLQQAREISNNTHRLVDKLEALSLGQQISTIIDGFLLGKMHYREHGGDIWSTKGLSMISLTGEQTAGFLSNVQHTFEEHFEGKAEGISDFKALGEKVGLSLVHLSILTAICCTESSRESECFFALVMFLLDAHNPARKAKVRQLLTKYLRGHDKFGRWKDVDNELTRLMNCAVCKDGGNSRPQDGHRHTFQSRRTLTPIKEVSRETIEEPAAGAEPEPDATVAVTRIQVERLKRITTSLSSLSLDEGKKFRVPHQDAEALVGAVLFTRMAADADDVEEVHDSSDEERDKENNKEEEEQENLEKHKQV